MLQRYSTLYDYTIQKFNFQAYITKTYYESKPLLLQSFVLKRNFAFVLFSGKLKLLRIGPCKILDSIHTSRVHTLHWMQLQYLLNTLHTNIPSLSKDLDFNLN